MDERRTLQALVDDLMVVAAGFRKLMASHMRLPEEKEATAMQVGTLFRLLEQPSTVSDLAKERKISLQSASVHVQSMVERGWVVRNPDPTDRRRALLEVTPEGMACAQAAHEHLKHRLAYTLDSLTEEEIAAAHVFLAALRRIVMKEGQNDHSHEM